MENTNKSQSLAEISIRRGKMIIPQAEFFYHQSLDRSFFVFFRFKTSLDDG